MPRGLIQTCQYCQLHTDTSRALRCAGWMPWGLCLPKREQLSGAGLCCCGIPRHSSPFPGSQSLQTRMSCWRKAASQAHRAPAHSEHRGWGIWFGALLSSWHSFRRDPRDYSCSAASGTILKVLWLILGNPSSALDFSVASNKLFFIFMCPHLEESVTGAGLRFDGLTCY